MLNETAWHSRRMAGKGKITTKQRPGQQSLDDLVQRNFTADNPNKKRLLRSSAPQVADLRTLKLNQTGCILPLLSMYSSELSWVGKYLIM
jgi:hypothetical protein